MLVEAIILVVAIGTIGVYFYNKKNGGQFNEELAKEIYKVDPKVQHVKEAATDYVQDLKDKVEDIVEDVKEDIEDVVETAEEAVQEVKKVVKKKTKKAEAKVKEKRSWYNNGKSQKLVPVSEVDSLPKTWKKGKLQKGDK